ncbi:MAG: oxaloacetate decarboxylase subunit alpha [Rhodospirillales bacterium RIFCSPLOWO2_12_FULL_58_28]|nr:MAG: oxaloacetate decarboxylase subunit alpha [Rhodospirillales bacterium RIFCSPLOWO2_02_FULL_58_16]OHC79669.1 MAG: oxaloacetate decarboxylase subunit alpha [Rhodospirillales bacterium RIFCSPLOWO2_12_FULL_58_28]
MTKPLRITELVLRDAHQSLLATRMRIEDMLPICPKLDDVGFWSLEMWGGAVFDSCIRFLGEDPWERLRRLKAALPKTPLQMLFRGQNILGYRNYGDDVVDKFVERCAANGIDVFRIFDAMNDIRNMERAIKATISAGKHAQGCVSYTLSPVHDLNYWLDLAKRLEDMGSHSICIKDMAGLITPYAAEELVSRLKETVAPPIVLHSHATTGMSTAAIVKASEAGVDIVDTAISTMSMTTSHSATESVVKIMEGTGRDTGLDLALLEEIAHYFRPIRKKYARFEGSIKGVDSRIILAQVPGGMLTNMESQLKEQGALDKMDAVLEEIPKVRKELGYLALVTPTSQIVGTQAVFNVMMGERYKTITKETGAVLRGEYGSTPAPVDKALQAKVLKKGEKPMTCRPADMIKPEIDRLTVELGKIAEEKNLRLADEMIEDVLTYALFPQVGLKFMENRGNPAAFEPMPTGEEPTAAAAPATTGGVESYRVVVNSVEYEVEIGPSGEVASARPTAAGDKILRSPMAGIVWKIAVGDGQTVKSGDVIVILEAMKMETEVRAARDGVITDIKVKEGDAVQAGDTLLTIE